MNRILLVSTTNVSPFPPAEPPPPLKPGSPSRTPFLPDPDPLAPKPRFIGLLGSQWGGSNPEDAELGPDSALVLPLALGEEPEVEGEAPECELLDGGVEDIGGGLAESVTLVPSSKRSSACCTPSPPTSRPPPHVPKSLPPRRASLSISSMCIMPILSTKSA